MVLRHGPGSARYTAGASFVALLSAGTSPALYKILIERGDASDIAIMESPNLGGDSKVELAGNIVPSHHHWYRVASASLGGADARTRLKLAVKVLPRRTRDALRRAGDLPRPGQDIGLSESAR
jgi:hypothetical protein